MSSGGAITGTLFTEFVEAKRRMEEERLRQATELQVIQTWTTNMDYNPTLWPR